MEHSNVGDSGKLDFRQAERIDEEYIGKPHKDGDDDDGNDRMECNGGTRDQPISMAICCLLGSFVRLWVGGIVVDAMKPR